MMGKGFIFHCGSCVNCGACSAACILYNGWDIKPRNIYTCIDKNFPNLPLINVSLACNHCENPSCLQSCPSGAFSRIPGSGAIVLDENKCIGCRYCQWNCPYDAPKFNRQKRHMEKCHLCYDSGEAMPSCALACPTGALSYGDMSGRPGDLINGWFSGEKLRPAFEFSDNSAPGPLVIIPKDAFGTSGHAYPGKSIAHEWSLILFTFLAIVSVTNLASSLINGNYPGILFLSQLLFTGFISLFHLGRPFLAWRALLNPLSSPLSREIYAFLVFSCLSAAAIILKLPAFLLAASISGLTFLIFVDSVYLVPDKKMLPHSGQTFISALLLISYFTGHILPFSFIVIIKTILSAYWLKEKKFQPFRFLRMSILIIACAGLISGLQSVILTLLVVSSELIDRILFYLDFEPGNIKQLTQNNFKEIHNEKKRG